MGPTLDPRQLSRPNRDTALDMPVAHNFETAELPDIMLGGNGLKNAKHLLRGGRRRLAFLEQRRCILKVHQDDVGVDEHSRCWFSAMDPRAPNSACVCPIAAAMS